MAEELLLENNGKPSAHLTKPLLAVAFLASFGSSMLYGYNLAVVNSPAQYIKDFYNETMVERYDWAPDEELLTILYSVTVSIFAIGGMTGALLVGRLVTKYGRKGTLVRSAVLVFTGGALMGFSRACRMPVMVIVGRFITGVHSGICLSVVPMYLGEIAPKNLRGFLGLVPSIHICLGVFLAQVLGLSELLGKEEYWPLLLSLVVFPTIIQLMFLPWFPESPRYLLIEKGNVDATIAALKWYRPKGNIQAEVDEMQEEQRSLSSIQTISVWGLLRDRSCFTIERLGRRPLMIGGFLFMGLCCTGITVSVLLQTQLSFMRYISVGCVVGIIAGFCIGPAGVPFLITAELFKQSHRPAAYTVAGCLNWMSNFTIGFVFPFLENATGPYCYLIFCVVCLGVAVYTIFVIPETKNKTFMEISQMFAARNNIREEDLTSNGHLKMAMRNGYGTLSEK
ncbi:solute carrier family 2 member 15b [Anarhichas minor]|uniref:solute carrier family 2 member 15b n=1 Tax=Anarhichas minor TaxID=65739 RepID=UPI003F73B9FD